MIDPQRLRLAAQAAADALESSIRDSEDLLRERSGQDQWSAQGADQQERAEIEIARRKRILAELRAALTGVALTASSKDYVASPETLYRYPAAGDPTPPGGAKVLLLTKGGMCVSGPWSSDGRYLAWAPMPMRDKAKEAP